MSRMPDTRCQHLSCCPCLSHSLSHACLDMQTSQVVKQYYKCLEEGSPYTDNEWARMQAEATSQGPTKPGNRGTRGGPPTPSAYNGSQGGRGNAGGGRGACFK